MDRIVRLVPRNVPPPDVLVTRKLLAREPRARDFEREARLLRKVMRELLRSPNALIQRIADVACSLTAAPSAGVSLIVEGVSGKHFSWVAMAGRYAGYIGGSTPLDHSPCGLTLHKDGSQLFARPGRFYESLAAAEPELVEGLVVPIKGVHGFPLGTIWVAAHNDGPEFDLEDARILESLADCFGAALELVQTRDEAVGRAEQMARAVTEAVSSTERKTDSLATVAHELRNPIAPITTAVQALKLTSCTDQQKALLSIIERQASRLGKLVGDMLDVARIERGEFTLDIGTLELVTLVDEALYAVAEQMRAKAQLLQLSFPSQTVLIRGDQEKLLQALTNLLQNASKYTPEHGRIMVEAHTDSRTLRLIVADSGIGIPPEGIPRLFQLYGRAPNALGERGLGIGLWMVQRIINLHGGEITVESAGTGKGARFTITVPLVQ